jgi:hypothetical protein
LSVKSAPTVKQFASPKGSVSHTYPYAASSKSHGGCIDSAIKSLEEIPKEGKFEPKPSFLQSKPLLRSLLIHGGRLVVSVALVTGVAVVFSVVFSKSISDFAVDIFLAAVTLFAAWESRSR